MADPNYGSRQDGYTSLSPSYIPGSVPVAAEVDAMVLPFQEGNLQTFPPNNARTKLMGSYPSNHEAEGSRPESGDETQGGLPRFLKVLTYQPYFNVDTEEVFQRIFQSLFLNGGEFMSMTNHNPDLYGPFWICTTLIFVASAFGNFALYLSNNSTWQYDIGKVNWAAGLFYAYTFLLPLVLYFILKYIGVVFGLVQLWCLHGYSLFIFIPASALAVIPTGVVKWIIVAGAALISTTFVTMNIKTRLGSNECSYIVVLGLIISHACFALAFKFLLFA